MTEQLPVDLDVDNDPSLSASRVGTCLFVLGMHRSGTSAVTSAVTALGVAGPSPERRMVPSRWNERGNLESRALRRMNDRLLRRLGGTWSGPPALEPGWEQGAVVNGLREGAAHCFAGSFPSRPMAWKDPRNCLTLPFWRGVLAPPAASLFVYRDPLEVARSLHARDHLSMTEGVALWDRYTRSVCANLQGLPTMVVEYAQALAHPIDWIAQLRQFLGEVGIPVTSDNDGHAAASMVGDLRHHDGVDDASLSLHPRHAELLEVLRTLDAVQPSWQPPDIPPAPPWVDDVLELRRRLDVVTHQRRRERRAAQSQTSGVTRLRARFRHFLPVPHRSSQVKDQ